MPSDIVLRDCRVLNVITGEILNRDIEILGDRVKRLVEIGHGEGVQTIDCDGKYVSYGFSDVHFHSESSMLSLPELACILIQRGTSDIYINPHEVANVGGLSAVSELVNQTKDLPINIHIIAPCKVPTAPSLESSGASFGTKELAEMLSWPSCVGIGELDGFKLLHRREPYQSFIEMAQERGLAVCGSINGFSGEQLQLCIAQGATDDHESVSGDEALEKLRSGCFIHARENSSARNLDSILQSAKKHPECLSRIMFCCDDRDAHELLEDGHIDDCIRKAIGSGLTVAQAYRMATLSAAEYYRQRDSGLVAAGNYANLVLLSDLEQVEITDVFFKGERIVKDGNLLWKPAGAKQRIPDIILWKKPLRGEDLLLQVPAGERKRVRIMKIYPDQIVSKMVIDDLPVLDGFIAGDIAKDIQHFSLAERYQGKGTVVNGFVSGFGLKEGAIAASIAHDHHHLISVGANAEDMAFALNRIAGIGGGVIVVGQGHILAELPLPYWGLLSDQSAQDTVNAIAMLKEASSKLGCTMENPFTTLSLMCLPVIPECGFTNYGLVDVKAQKIVPVVLED